MSKAVYLGTVKAEEGIGAIGQEELQRGGLQQEARVVQLGQLHERPPLMRARRPLLAVRHKRQLSDSVTYPSSLESFRYTCACTSARPGLAHCASIKALGVEG